MRVIEFNFRHKIYTCHINIISSGYPYFVFVNLHDTDLINEFGQEVTIKTDGEIRLTKNDDRTELIELRQSIFDVIKLHPEFIAANHNNHVGMN